MWQDVLVAMVRTIIGDLGSTQTYSDGRIQQAVIVSAMIVINEYPFSTDYVIDIGNFSMSPDPTETATLDNLAIALFALKAAAMLSLNSYQTAVGAGIRVRDGDSEVDTTSGFKGYQDILKLGPMKAYEDLLKKASFNRNIGKAIMSPASTEAYGRYAPVFFDSVYALVI